MLLSRTLFFFGLCLLSANHFFAQFVGVASGNSSSSVSHLVSVISRAWSEKDGRFVTPMKFVLEYSGGQLLKYRSYSTLMISYTKDSLDLVRGQAFGYLNGRRMISYGFPSNTEPVITNATSINKLYLNKYGLPAYSADSLRGSLWFRTKFEYDQNLSLKHYYAEQNKRSAKDSLLPFSEIVAVEGGFTTNHLAGKQKQVYKHTFDSVSFSGNSFQVIEHINATSENWSRFKKYVFNSTGGITYFCDYFRDKDSVFNKHFKEAKYFCDDYGRPVALRDSQIVRFEVRHNLQRNASNEMYIYSYEPVQEGKIPSLVSLKKLDDVILVDWYGDMGTETQLLIFDESMKLCQYNFFKFGQCWFNPSGLIKGNYFLVLLVKEQKLGTFCRFVI